MSHLHTTTKHCDNFHSSVLHAGQYVVPVVVGGSLEEKSICFVGTESERDVIRVGYHSGRHAHRHEVRAIKGHNRRPCNKESKHGHLNKMDHIRKLLQMHWSRQWLGAEEATSHYLNHAELFRDYIPQKQVMNECSLLLMSMLWHRQAIFKSEGDELSSSAECRIRFRVFGTESPADWMPTDKPTELSRIKL